MLHIPRSLTPVLAAAVIAAVTSSAQAQFWFGQQPQRKPPARQAAPVPQTPLAPAPFAEKASFNDTARFLAGLPPVENSPLEQVARDPLLAEPCRVLQQFLAAARVQRLSKIRNWSAANLKDRSGMPMYYMFSGPDFLYANAFYPNASTYVLSGLEPVGRIPVINDVTRSSLGNLRSSMASSISLSFFITKNMKHQLRETALSGTLPILMVYIARAGKTINDVSLVTLQPGWHGDAGRGAIHAGVQGAKIIFTGGPGKPLQTLYYFSTDVSDSGVKNSRAS